MSRHDQQVQKAQMVCAECKAGVCEFCVDGLRLFYTNETICTCGRTDHSDKMRGEPRLGQVRDPFTGDIHAPGLVVTEDGTVEFTDGNPFGQDEGDQGQI